jgi:hypothetical protein
MNYSILRKQWLERFLAWANANDDIRAVILVGSMGRTVGEPADEWSDVDLLFITARPDEYTRDNAWMKEIGPFWAGVLPPDETFSGLLPVQCGFSAFEGGVAAEYFILPSARTKLVLPLIRLLNRIPSLRRWCPKSIAELGADVGDVLRNGAKVILDKDGLAKQLIETTLAIPVEPPSPPSQIKFQNNLDDFWIGPPKIVAGLQRGKLMSAIKPLELTRRDLLKMVEWHARAKDGWQGNDLAFRPTQIEAWAEPRVKEVLPRLFASYNSDKIWDTLFAMMELYSWLAVETADALEYPCVSEADRIISWVKECSLEYPR